VRFHAIIVQVMATVLDHVFICTAVGAPAADILRGSGFVEGPPNRHPGQGTACRRFFFRNGMLELIWVEDEAEARAAAETRLWERWRAAGKTASPFGIILRPAPDAPAECPIPSWQNRPAAMPDLVLEVAADTGIAEPMWCFHPWGRTARDPGNSRDITGLQICSPPLPDDCVTRRMAAAGCVTLEPEAEHRIEVELDGGRQGGRMDLRPELPLVVRI
jgi:hypothetical protein